jgi:hypothetical protein
VIGPLPATIAGSPDVCNCYEKASSYAVRRIAPPRLFGRRNTQFELRYRPPEAKEFLIPYFCAMM